MVLGTFYPLDIKGDTPGVLLQIEKSMLRHTHLKFHFRRNPHFQRVKKKAIANKNDYRTGGFYFRLEQGLDWDQAQTVNKLGSVLGQLLLALLIVQPHPEQSHPPSS